MKNTSSLTSLKKRGNNAQIVRRRGRIFVLNKTGINRRMADHQQANMNQGRATPDVSPSNLANVGRTQQNNNGFSAISNDDDKFSKRALHGAINKE